MPATSPTLSSTTRFGDFLKQLRKRAGMSQSDLAAALGYSFSFISALEQNRRLPDLQAVVQSYLPALGLQDEPKLAAQLVELAALARGEKPPASFTIKRERQLVIREEIEETSHSLPIPPMPLLGREQEVKQLCNRLHGHSERLLTLIGPPGVGKTRLALAVTSEMQSLYRDGACFVPLAAVSDPNLVAMTLVSALNLHEGSSKPPQARLIEYLRRKELLLVLDNFEQITAAAPLVAELLAQCGGLRILVTSRERLHLRAEQRFKVQPLALDPAVELFVQRVQATEETFLLTAQNRSILEAICRKLDCLPLAIELSAPRCEVLSPQQLLDSLQRQPLALLSDGAVDLPEHQRSLRLAIQHSYINLPSHAQLLFRTLGVFVGGFDLLALGDFGFEVMEVQALLHKSLLSSVASQTRSDANHRFYLLETLRTYALEQIQLHGEQTLFAHHANYFLKLAERAASKMQGQEQVEWLKRLDLDLGNLRAAFQWFRQHEPAQAIALAGALKEFWLLRGYYQEGRQWLIEALDYQAAPAHLRARALLSAGQLINHLGEPALGLTLVEESIALYRQTGEPWALADALRVSGWVYDELHQREPKIAAFEESLQLFRQLGDGAKTAALLVSLVYAYGSQQMGYTKASGYLRESVELLKTTGDIDALLFALSMQGDLEIQFGNYQAAAVACAETLKLARKSDFKRHVAWNLIRAGEIKRHLGEATAAIGDLQEALKLSIELGDKDALKGTWRTLGDVQRTVGDAVAACHAYQQTLSLCLETNDRHQAIHSLIGCAILAIAQNKNTGAAHFLSKAQQWVDNLPPFLAIADRTELADMLAYIQRTLDERAWAEVVATTQSWTLAEVVPVVQLFCEENC
ncbi:MAG: helix-turn-helix domain-containing protein [Caldilineaceae bacterium]